jgi:hypothetical protein
MSPESTRRTRPSYSTRDRVRPSRWAAVNPATPDPVTVVVHSCLPWQVIRAASLLRLGFHRFSSRVRDLRFPRKPEQVGRYLNKGWEAIRPRDSGTAGGVGPSPGNKQEGNWNVAGDVCSFQ